jgi:hypothetical protein
LLMILWRLISLLILLFCQDWSIFLQWTSSKRWHWGYEDLIAPL